MTIDIAQVTTNLEQRDHGVWFSKAQSAVSYPEEGNEWFHEIEENSFWFRHRNNCITQVMQTFPPPGTVFDVGGGNGFVSLAIKNAGLDVALVEPGLVGVRNAVDRGITPVICSTLEDAGFQKNSIPAIGLFDIIEHLEDDVDFLRTAADLLIPNGKLYLTVPAYGFLWSIEDVFAKHYRRYTVADLATKLEQCGFAVEFASYIFALLPFPIFVFRTLPSKLKFRKEIHLERERNEHALTAGWLGALINQTLSIELRLIQGKRRVPFGASCLVVAQSPRNAAPHLDAMTETLV